MYRVEMGTAKFKIFGKARSEHGPFKLENSFFMNKNRTISVRLSRDRIEALANLYAWLINEFHSENDYESLLYAHVVQMHYRLGILLRRTFRNKTILFSEPEALAFCEICGKWNIDHDRFAKFIAKDIAEKIRDAMSLRPAPRS